MRHDGILGKTALVSFRLLLFKILSLCTTFQSIVVIASHLTFLQLGMYLLESRMMHNKVFFNQTEIEIGLLEVKG